MNGAKKRDFFTNDKETLRRLKDASLAPANVPVLLCGFQGAGFTEAARLLHEISKRKGRFETVNCAAHTDKHLEAELFSPRRQSSSGKPTRPGKLLKNDGGTLFLCKAEKMSRRLQSKLAKFLNENLLRRSTSENSRSSGFRLVSCTTSDPDNITGPGRLNKDLFQSLNGIVVRLKPLSERRGDILPLIRHFSSKGRRLVFSKEAGGILLDYAWPHNFREIKRLARLLSCSKNSKGIISAESVMRHLYWRFY